MQSKDSCCCYDCMDGDDEYKQILCLECKAKYNGFEVCTVCKSYRCSYCNINGFVDFQKKVFYYCEYETCSIVVCNDCYYRSSMPSCDACTDDHYCSNHSCISCKDIIYE